MQVHNPASSDLKCPTCLVNFDSSQQHKQHYKSEFHRYNLKRKMVKLAPATLEQFKSKKSETVAEEVEDYKCNECGKKFNSANTFNQHVRTKNHNPNLVRETEPAAKNKKAPAFSKNKLSCIFCLAEAANFSQNLRHMQSAHSFFIPEVNFCTNKQGLVEYLQQKVEVGFLCITCENKNAKDFSTGEAVRKHMSDKGHCFMKTDQGFDQYLEYYDFSSQFKEILEDQKDRYIPGIEYTTIKVVVKNDKDKPEAEENEDDWQDDSQGSASQQDQQWQDEEEETEIKQKQEQKAKKQVKTYHLMRPTKTSNGELLLPNGKILGHRKYRYLYKQTYRTTFWLNKDIKALGYEFANNALITKQRLLQLQKQEKLLYRHKHRWDKKQLHDGMQNNLLQKFFRTSNSL